MKKYEMIEAAVVAARPWTNIQINACRVACEHLYDALTAPRPCGDSGCDGSCVRPAPPAEDPDEKCPTCGQANPVRDPYCQNPYHTSPAEEPAPGEERWYCYRCQKDHGRDGCEPAEEPYIESLRHEEDRGARTSDNKIHAEESAPGDEDTSGEYRRIDGRWGAYVVNPDGDEEDFDEVVRLLNRYRLAAARHAGEIAAMKRSVEAVVEENVRLKERIETIVNAGVADRRKLREQHYTIDGLREGYELGKDEIARLRKERDDARDMLDKEWVTHQEIIAQRSERDTLAAREKALEAALREVRHENDAGFISTEQEERIDALLAEGGKK